MALSMALPIAAESVITATFSERLIVRQQVRDFRQWKLAETSLAPGSGGRECAPLERRCLSAATRMRKERTASETVRPIATRTSGAPAS